MITKPLPFIILLILYLFFCLPLWAQDALFKVHYAGMLNDGRSEEVKEILSSLGRDYGFELVEWDKSCLDNPASLPEVVFAIEDGDLWKLDNDAREKFSEYLIGGEGRRGGALICVRLSHNFENTKIEAVRQWDWLEGLIYPESQKWISTITDQRVPNQAILNISGKSGNKWIPSHKGAFSRQLPHPTPLSEYEGAKVYFSPLADFRPKHSQHGLVPNAVKELWAKALLWTSGFDDGSNLNVPYLALSAENVNQQVRLDWVTNLEINNDFFEVQRSTDGETWTPQMRLNAIGDENENSFYDFTEYQLSPGRYYYRLLQQNRDGTQAFSGIVVVDIEIPDPLVYVFPNPVSEMLAIETSTGEESVLDYSIESINGTRVWQQHSEAKQAFHRIEVGVNQLPPGIYQLRVRSENGERVQQFIKY
ncbi:MAG: T9SS type A sorting domain-containing protein [Bacteroidota bacterium]